MSALKVRFILIETSHPGNIGSVCRAMKTMGLLDLWLVNPRVINPALNAEALALASGANDLLEQAKVVTSLTEALEGVQYAVALSARLREFGPPAQSVRTTMAQLSATPGLQQVAFIFGNERYGLPNEVLKRCQLAAMIPANPAYSSLNLAQAVQVVAYECREAGWSLEDGVAKQPEAGFTGAPATVEQIEGLHAHLEQTLAAVGFLDMSSPKRLMDRLRRLFGRTTLEVEEVNILRGMCRAIQDKLRQP